MSAIPKRKLTATEYLALDRAAEFRSEFLNSEMFAMAGASYEHNRINGNLSAAFGNALRGTQYSSLSSDMRVKTGLGDQYAFPDKIVICSEPQFEDGRRDILLNPRVLIEILSPSTEGYDRGAKFRHFRLIPTLQEVVFISQFEAVCERHVRGPDDVWMLTTFSGLDAELVLTSVPVRVPLRDIDEGVPLMVGGSADLAK